MAKTVDDILLLGDPALYERSDPVLLSEREQLKGWISDMHAVVLDFRNKYHFGRAIAAPQLGIKKRLVYMLIDRPIIFINPVLMDPSEELFELWDDCMSFPHLLVRIRRHRTVRVRYLDEDWQEREWLMADDLSELIQHEYDHLDGILCTMRAIDEKSFRWREPISAEPVSKK
jgi:peptide deformylase